MRSPLALATLAVSAACATLPDAKLAMTSATPTPGSPVGADTTLRIGVFYQVDQLAKGQDGVAALFKTQDGGRWEAARQVITEPSGRLVFELSGAELSRNAALVQPYQVRFVLDRRTGPGQTQTLKDTGAFYFARPPEQTEEQEKTARFVPPSVGKGQLLSDMVNDPRYKPQLPPALNKNGMVVWGTFKLCVDTAGDVFAVKILRSADPLVDADWVSVLRRLKHLPYTIAGQAVPYCYPLRLEVRSIADPPPLRRR